MPEPLVRDLERRLRRSRQEVVILTETVVALRQELEAYRHLNGSLHPDYVLVMADITHAAYYGVRRPADYGGTLSGGHMESQVPRHDADAYKLLVKTQGSQSRDALQLRKRLSQIVDGESPPKEEA